MVAGLVVLGGPRWRPGPQDRAGTAPGFRLCRVPGGGLAGGWPGLPVPGGRTGRGYACSHGPGGGIKAAVLVRRYRFVVVWRDNGRK
jgi:hypothetical protein